jgi:ATP-independent RNA helicase DbpA
MTPIQAQSLPPMLAGEDVIAQGKTGSGKTAAFGLALLSKLKPARGKVQALVLCPTRELADQVAKAIRELARTTPNVKVLTLCGGLPYSPQAASLSHGADVVVGTPGRIEDHLGKGSLQLGAVHTLVLDEADRMLDMGFQDSLEAIVKCIPSQRQTLLFSATYPDAIQSITRRVMRKPVRVLQTETHDEATIEQHFYRVEDEAHRQQALRLLLLAHRPASAVVFCETKLETQALAEALRSQRFSVLALHGDLDQRERERTLVCFANRSASLLVATDVAARGLDIDELDAVINYQPARDSQVHVHRVGRTGRAGSRGMAMTLYTDGERHKIDALADYLQRELLAENLPPKRGLEETPDKAAMVTLQVDGGKKKKLRPGDILGALTGESGVPGKQVGKIDIFDTCAFVAVHRDVAKAALLKLTEGKMKGRSFRVRRL